MSAARYALWLSPAGTARERLQALIALLAARLGTPAFAPHVTLLAGLTPAHDMPRATRALATQLEPLSLRLGRVKYLDEYYRSLFVEVEATRALLHARACAVERFASAPSAYYPHLSLVYGELAAQRKQDLIDELGLGFDETLTLTRLELIEVTDGPESWRRIERAALGGDDNAI